MFSPALGATTAVWLMLAPALELESGPRAYAAIASGVAALILSPAGIWSRAARAALAWVGLAVALLNFVLPGSIGALANLATCGVVLIIAGAAPSPQVAFRSVVVPAAANAPAVAATVEESGAPSRSYAAAA